jgi:hypothetical protein
MDARPQRMWDEAFDRRRLRDLLPRVGVHPDDVITMLRYAPLALTHLTWRNTVLEDWHAAGRIHDPDMFRTNADTTVIFHQALWSAFGEQIGSGDLVSLDDVADQVSVEVFETALLDAYDGVFDADRTLPNGMTLGELAQDELAVLQDYATTQVAALIDKAEAPGVDVVLLFLAMRGGGSCARWWGSPRWPAIVDQFIALLTDPANDWWQHHRKFPQQRPAEAADLDRLRYLLLARPHRLSYEAADFCIDNGIGFVQLDGPLPG